VRVNTRCYSFAM